MSRGRVSKTPAWFIQNCFLERWRVHTSCIRPGIGGWAGRATRFAWNGVTWIARKKIKSRNAPTGSYLFIWATKKAFKWNRQSDSPDSWLGKCLNDYTRLAVCRFVCIVASSAFIVGENEGIFIYYAYNGVQWLTRTKGGVFGLEDKKHKSISEVFPAKC